MTLLLVVLTGCLTPRTQHWPASLPRQHHFVTAWQADESNQRLQSREEYLNWVRVFYTGTVVYPRGWLNIQSELSERAEPGLRPRLSSELEILGIVIGAEWAKANEGRIIDSQMLSLWGSILQMSQVSDQEFEAVALIADDVTLLLGGALQKSEIDESRYASRLDIEAFGDF